MKDRAESGRGRPYNAEVLTRIQKLEDNMKDQRAALQSTRTGEATMLWTCKETRQTMYLDFPLKYTPTEALEMITRQDIDHTHIPWETYSL
jgi:hypothetical protein